MSAPSRGMSDSSYYETQAGSGYEGTFPGQSIPETSPRISTSDSRGAPDTSLLQGSLETSSNYHSFKKHVRSRFREELGEVMPDQSPRFRIVSKLRGLSRHGRHSTRGKDASEVTNHIFLSEYVPKDVEARRKLVYHGCPQAAESAPEGWQQSLRRKELSASGSYPGETQSVHEPKLSANEPWFVYPTARPELDVAVESSSELALRPLRTIHARSRAGDGPLVMSECPSQGTTDGLAEHYSGMARGVTSSPEWQQRMGDSEPRNNERLRRGGVGDTMGRSDSVPSDGNSKGSLRSHPWPFYRRSKKAENRSRIPPFEDGGF